MNQELYASLIAGGMDEAMARKIASEGESGKSKMPFDVIKINYDKEDVLIDLGVKKGAFISGYQIDKSTLSVKQEGKIFNQPMEVVVASVTHQASTYDPSKGGYKYVTPFFDDAFDTPKIVEFKTGKTIGQLRKEVPAQDKPVFNTVLLLLVKEGKEYTPYIMYLRGKNLFEFNQQLKDEGFDKINKVKIVKTMKWKTKKVPTKATPAWVIDLVDIKQNPDIKPNSSFMNTLIEATKEFDAWKESFNAENAQKNSVASTTTNNVTENNNDVASQEPDIDVNDIDEEPPF